ncbi:probable sepB protein [Cephalotrichum gorgonifer]|uniref:Probable sepB protein n=1 Tax=Cephalotrichum gorgonifer TaxID=2041049 RepID=A0AAE8N1X7_9PEZI|nr:probable sepB protein [Cephalotrichum gorgonifer]
MDTPGSKPRPRPAHTKGTTRCAYTPDGSRLVTVGSNNTIRLYKTGFDGEPTNIDECPEQNIAVAASSDSFVVGSEDGTVSLYSIATASFERFLMRCSLPIRDLTLSPDGRWCAVASDELTVKVVNTEDNLQVRTLKEHARPTKHIAFDPKGSLLALTCTDGVIYVYSMTSEAPELIKKVDSVIGVLDLDSDISGAARWHPDGRSFAVPTPTRDVQVVSKNDWEKQRRFANGHLGDITALAWSPNGAMLATAGRDGKILIWETKTQSVIDRHHFNDVIDLAWHPKSNNTLSFTTSEGEVYIHTDFVTDQFSSLLKLPIQPSPFYHDPLEANGNGRRPELTGKSVPSRPRRDSLASLEDAVLDDLDDYGMDGDLDDFVEDDDGAGYTSGRKRPAEDDGHGGEHASKRRHLMQPQIHAAFQPGSTPWRGNRKYLCLNLIGVVWTVDQDDHYTVTVEFYDREFHRDFHFTDTFLYDKACLNEKGALFSCPPNPKADLPAYIFYRPHETWTQRSDWRTELPKGESVVAISLSDSFVTAVTSAGYVRVYTLFGIPYKVYRPKSAPVVTCASWKDYVLTMGNGAVGADGQTRLHYSIENIKRDEICQNEDTVALPEGATIKSVFFSDKGDPCIYDSTGTLLTLLHWRRPSRASWVPLLDTRLLTRLASGRKHESYYPIAVADNKFHCIILKGGDQYPYFPRPLLSEFEFSVPLTSPQAAKKPKRTGTNGEADDEDAEDEDEVDEEAAEASTLAQQFLVTGILAAQVRDKISDGGSAGHAERSLLGRLNLEIDKTLLKMLAAECRNGEDRGMRALEMVELMRDRTGRMVEAAVKVADRYDRGLLVEKIREVGERRVNGMDEDEE